MPKSTVVSWFAESKERLLFVSAIIWSALIFSHYFSPKTVFDLSFLRHFGADAQKMNLSIMVINLGLSLSSFLWDAGVLIILWAWGRRIARWMGLPPMNPALTLCLQMGLGIIFFNTLWLGTGLNGLWVEPFLLVLSLVFLGVALWDVSKVFRNFDRVHIPALPTGLTLGLVLLGLAAWVLALAQGMVPEVYFDGLVYHLSVLKFWEYHHGITDFATNFHSYYPFGAELYLFNGFWEAGGPGAKILNASAMGLLALAAAGWAAEEAGAAWAWVTFGMVLTFPWVSSTAWTTQNEIVLSFFILLFFYTSRRWAREKENRRRWVWLALAGLWGGAALTVKYTAAPAIAAGFAALGLENRGIFRKEKIREWLMLFLLFSAALLPWLMKNQIYTGDVLYPYFSQWLGGRSLSPGRFQELLGNHESVLGTGMPLWRWPYELVARHLDKTIGPLLFSFIPFLLAAREKWKPVRYFLVLSFLYLAEGFLISYQTRLMTPEIVMFTLAAACLMARIKSEKLETLWIFLVFLYGLLICFSLGRLSTDYYQSQKIWLGIQTRQEFLERSPQTASFYSLAEAADHLPAQDHLLIVGDARGLYYPRPYWTNSVFDDPELATLTQKSKDAEGIGEGLRRLGVEDLVVSGEEGRRLSQLYAHAYPLTPEEWNRLDDFIQRGTDLIYAEGPNGIYRIHPLEPVSKPRIPDLLLLFQRTDSSQ